MGLPLELLGKLKIISPYTILSTQAAPIFPITCAIIIMDQAPTLFIIGLVHKPLLRMGPVPDTSLALLFLT